MKEYKAHRAGAIELMRAYRDMERIANRIGSHGLWSRTRQERREVVITICHMRRMAGL